MQRMIGIILIVLALWVGIEVYTEGTERAFGGLFASGSEEPDEQRSTPQRAADAVQRAYDKSAERIDRQLGE